MKRIDPLVLQTAALVVAGLVVGASWWWGYQPAVRAYGRDRDQIALRQQEIATVNALVKPAGGEAAWLAQHQQLFASLKARFPEETQLPQLLNALVDALKAGELRVADVTQGNLEPVQDQETPLLIGGLPCRRLPVTVKAEGRYHAVLAALDRITSTAFPGVVGLEQVELRVKDAAAPTLDTTVQLFLYVVGSSTARSPDA
ncbi:MAG: hypothetical protein HYY59_00380 [Candidatus Omnitrophica bacterium]|nr:hypothetical protein [Candidatus Omnitrophota bacterium]MBI3020447.1 hypothetical protein [Candidatus Omnitrophota bacterium]